MEKIRAVAGWAPRDGARVLLLGALLVGLRLLPVLPVLAVPISLALIVRRALRRRR